METQFLTRLHDNLLAKRQMLTAWLHTTPARKKQIRLGSLPEQAVHDHLQVIDAALAKAEANELGRCTVCHDYVDTALLEMDYTASVCLDHFSRAERRSLEAELALAQRVQQALLPHEVPVIPGLAVAAFSRPAQIIGGDYFDFFQFRGGAHGLAIGDVAGHGIAASLLMASLQTALSTLVPANNGPDGVVRHVNRLFYHNIRFTTFVTLFLGTFDPTTRGLTYCNAGHNPPLLCRGRENGGPRVDWLPLTGPAIGLVEEFQARCETTTLAPGDILLLYTDGVTEAANAQGELFGEERLAALIRLESNLSAQELVRAVRDVVGAFTEGQPLADDMTLVACKVED